MSYRAKVLTFRGQPAGRFVADWLARSGTFPRYPEDTGPAEEREMTLQPMIFIDVWDCRVRLAAEFELPGGRSAIAVYPGRLPRRIARMAEEDLWAQGGAINMSGRYRILSAAIHRFVESGRFQDWLREEARRLGLEVVEEEGENAMDVGD